MCEACFKLDEKTKHQVIVLSKHNSKVRIEFDTKKEKWLFLQEFLPDTADVVAKFANALSGIEPPNLWVDEDWLNGLDNIFIIDKRKHYVS